MNSKIYWYTGGILAAMILLAGAFSSGFIVGRIATPQSLPLTESISQTLPQGTPGAQSDGASASAQAETPQDLQTLFQPFWQSWDIVHDRFVDQPLDNEILMQGAIRGMMESLDDPHSSYMDPFQFNQANISLEGEYEGIGAWVDPNEEYLTIVSPMPNSPAEEVGLRPGDAIIAVNGDDMTGVDGNLVIRKVMGPAGTTVTLTIQREGSAEPFDVEVTRAAITIPSVESRMLEGDIGYLHLFTFGDESTPELRQALGDLLDQDPKGLIFDLRNNGGGALRTAIEVASEFIGDGVVMYEEYGDGTRDTYTAQRGGMATDIPMVVLINEGSASASEIVAGAIQDRERGQLVGTTSFGKGSVQQWIPLDNDQGAVRVTIARWLTPDERTISEIGLEPDVVVEMTQEDVQAGLDPQLDKAVELLQNQ